MGLYRYCYACEEESNSLQRSYIPHKPYHTRAHTIKKGMCCVIQFKGEIDTHDWYINWVENSIPHAHTRIGCALVHIEYAWYISRVCLIHPCVCLFLVCGFLLHPLVVLCTCVCVVRESNSHSRDPQCCDWDSCSKYNCWPNCGDTIPSPSPSSIPAHFLWLIFSEFLAPVGLWQQQWSEHQQQTATTTGETTVEATAKTSSSTPMRVKHFHPHPQQQQLPHRSTSTATSCATRPIHSNHTRVVCWVKFGFIHPSTRSRLVCASGVCCSVRTRS